MEKETRPGAAPPREKVNTEKEKANLGQGPALPPSTGNPIPTPVTVPKTPKANLEAKVVIGSLFGGLGGPRGRGAKANRGRVPVAALPRLAATTLPPNGEILPGVALLLAAGTTGPIRDSAVLRESHSRRQPAGYPQQSKSQRNRMPSTRQV